MSGKKAWVLGGGGAKGSYQIGVACSLWERGERPDAIYGTSVGAINAAGIVWNGAPKTTELWLGLRAKKDVLSFNWNMLWLGAKSVNTFKPLRKLLRKYVSGPPKYGEAVACKTSLKTGRVAYDYSSRMSTEDFLIGVEASGVIPAIMEPVDGEWVDGGVREMAPLKQAIKDGADAITVILCSPYVPLPQPWSKGSWPLPLKDIAYRALDILEHEVFVEDLKICHERNKNPRFKNISLKLYAPDRLYTDTLDFDPIKLKKAVMAGKQDGLANPVNLN